MFLFHSFTSGVSGPFTPTADELALSDEMIGYWANFAATGDPNGNNSPLPWPLYGRNADNKGHGNLDIDTLAIGSDKKDTFIQFDTPALADGAGFHSLACDFFDVLAGITNNGHGEGGIAGDFDEGHGNEPFITIPDDLDQDDR
jgi:hypothetical protein